MTFGADAAVSGAGVFRKAGEGNVVFTTATAPQKIALVAGTVTLPTDYAGSVTSAARGFIVCRKTTAEGVVYYLGKSFVISIQ